MCEVKNFPSTNDPSEQTEARIAAIKRQLVDAAKSQFASTTNKQEYNPEAIEAAAALAFYIGENTEVIIEPYDILRLFEAQWNRIKVLSHRIHDALEQG